MTGDHVPEGRLNDYAEGLLPADDAAAVERHLAACAGCAGEARSIRELRSAMASLPGSIDPGVDLLQGIRAERDRRVRRSSPTRSGILARRPLAAAAVLAVALAAATMVVLQLRSSDGNGDARMAPASAAATPAGSGDDPAATVLRLDREYDRAAGELAGVLRSAEDRLSPAASELVRSDLAAVERALAESRAALREDPASPVLRELVLSAHRQRLDVLRRATGLAAESEEAS